MIARVHILVGLLVVSACAAEPGEGEGDRGAAVVRTDAGEADPAMPVGAEPTSEGMCPSGAPLDDAALLARVVQGEKPALTVRGALRVAVRRCKGERCTSELPIEEIDVPLALARTPDGARWKGQVARSSSYTLTFDVDAAGVVTGDLVVFGANAATSPLEASASTSCLSARATATRDEGGERVESTISFRAEVPREERRTPIPDEPPLLPCDAPPVTRATDALGGAMRLGTNAAVVMEHVRDCRAPTGCTPWKTLPVAPDGGPSWSTPAAGTSTLTASATLALGRFTVQVVAAASTGATASLVTTAPFFTLGAPILGRGATDVKLTAGGLVLSEQGGARDDAKEPKIRARRFACLTYAR